MSELHASGTEVGAVPEDLKAWRKQMRTELLERRVKAGAQERLGWSRSIVQHLKDILPDTPSGVIGFCWPYKGEPDVLPAVRQWIAGGGKAALPVVVRPRAPMIFRHWYPHAPMTTGVYDIPIPADTEELHPDILLAPLTGFDGDGYRLGYGGGFFDRTVVTLTPRPLMIGVGFELSRMATIHPQPHDQPMDWIVTEAGARRRVSRHGP